MKSKVKREKCVYCGNFKRPQTLKIASVVLEVEAWHECHKLKLFEAYWGACASCRRRLEKALRQACREFEKGRKVTSKEKQDEWRKNNG